MSLEAAHPALPFPAVPGLTHSPHRRCRLKKAYVVMLQLQDAAGNEIRVSGHAVVAVHFSRVFARPAASCRVSGVARGAGSARMSRP
jgi:hypothetical protein